MTSEGLSQPKPFYDSTILLLNPKQAAPRAWMGEDALYAPPRCQHLLSIHGKRAPCQLQTQQGPFPSAPEHAKKTLWATRTLVLSVQEISTLGLAAPRSRPGKPSACLQYVHTHN